MTQVGWYAVYGPMEGFSHTSYLFLYINILIFLSLNLTDGTYYPARVDKIEER